MTFLRGIRAQLELLGQAQATRLPLSDDAKNNGGVDEDAATEGSAATPLPTAAVRPEAL
jgi:hypothetical protein